MGKAAVRQHAYEMFRDKLAEAVHTTRERVLLSCIHQHDAPYFDLTAQKLLVLHRRHLGAHNGVLSSAGR